MSHDNPGGWIPLCVPRWDERQVLDLGARYDKARGFHLAADDFLDDFWEWLPLRWKHPDKPALIPGMLPVTTFENNVRTRLPAERWDRLRRHVYAAAGHRCEACGADGNPHIECHEDWAFDEATGIQRLVRLIALCPLCHKAFHLGYAGRLGIRDQVLAHIQRVNGWDAATLAGALTVAEADWARRSGRHWTLDLSWLENTGFRHI